MYLISSNYFNGKVLSGIIAKDVRIFLYLFIFIFCPLFLYFKSTFTKIIIIIIRYHNENDFY